jgi:hypothetical protein
MNVLEILGSGGDVKVEWDPEDPDSVEQARAEFDAIATGKGMRIMKILEDGTTEGVTEFDPTAGRYVAIPQLVGG